MPRQDEKAALAAEPGRRRRRFSKFKPFGLKMFLKYRPTEESDLERRFTPNDGRMVGTCTVTLKRWPSEYGYSQETCIDQLQGLSEDHLINKLMCISVVRTLWNSGPLEAWCGDHLIANKSTLGETEVWAWLLFIGFKPCACPEFSHAENLDETWCYGNRIGNLETETGLNDKLEEGEVEEEEEEEEDGDDDDDDKQEG